MEFDIPTLACSYGIPTWWLMVNFDKNMDLGIKAYMKELHSKWNQHSAKIRNYGWFVPNYSDIKKRFLAVGVETRPCYDCKKEVGYNDVAYARMFGRNKMPAGGHFNVFVLCTLCASKEHIAGITSNPAKAIEKQMKKSNRQILIEAELAEEQKIYDHHVKQLRKIKKDQEQLEHEKGLAQPLAEELERIKKENDEKREEIEKFRKEKADILGGFDKCSEMGQIIIESLAEFSKEIQTNTEKLDEVTSDYEQTFSDGIKCGICWIKKERFSAINPCFHAFCEDCCSQTYQCPLCKTPVISRQKILFP